MKTGATVTRDPQEAVRNIAEQIEISDPALVLFYCSAEYSPEIISHEMRQVFTCPVIGCTSAGEIGRHFQKGGMVAVSLPKEHFTVAVEYIDTLDSFSPSCAEDLVESLQRGSGESVFSNANVFALTLIDGLSAQEELYVSALNEALHGVPLIGGSAGDNLHFEKTTIFCNGSYGSNAAVIALIRTDLPVQVLKHMHIEPTEHEMIITSADPDTRTVYEIDGAAAADEYALALGCPVEDLTPAHFSRHPLMLHIQDDWYVRSIQKVNDDKSLTFFCAIDEGIPLTIGRSNNAIEFLSETVQEIEASFGEIALTLGFDCILRRLELEDKGLTAEAEALFQRLSLMGFSTYGEQIGGIHVNQTLTGVVIGK